MMVNRHRRGVLAGEVIVAVAAVALILGAGWAYVTISAPVSTTSLSSIQTSGSASSGSSSGSGNSSSGGSGTTGSGGSSSVTIPQGAGSGQNFSPSSLTVAPGTAITFTDQDTTAMHNVHFTSGPSGATLPGVSPNLNKGSTFQVTLTTPGTYNYDCDYHSWMKGTITVS